MLRSVLLRPCLHSSNSLTMNACQPLSTFCSSETNTCLTVSADRDRAVTVKAAVDTVYDTSGSGVLVPARIAVYRGPDIISADGRKLGGPGVTLLSVCLRSASFVVHPTQLPRVHSTGVRALLIRGLWS